MVHKTDYTKALEFTSTNSIEDIDDYRRTKIDWVLALCDKCIVEQPEWIREIDHIARALAQKSNGPLARALIELTYFGDPYLAGDLAGFPFVGVVRSGFPNAKPKDALAVEVDIEELRGLRETTNEIVLEAVKSTEWDHDIFSQTVDDAEFGAMTFPRLLLNEDLLDKTLTRRIPVREERSNGWRTRVVDHFTEGGPNLATVILMTVVNGSVCNLVDMAKVMLAANVSPRFWKRDISKAFRRLIIDQLHAEFTWVVFHCARHLDFETHWTSLWFGLCGRSLAQSGDPDSTRVGEGIACPCG